MYVVPLAMMQPAESSQHEDEKRVASSPPRHGGARERDGQPIRIGQLGRPDYPILSGGAGSRRLVGVGWEAEFVGFRGGRPLSTDIDWQRPIPGGRSGELILWDHSLRRRQS